MDVKKTWRRTFLFLAGVVCGAVLAYLFTKNQLQWMADEPFLYWQHAASQREAEAYLRVLEPLDSGMTNDFARVRRRGRAVFHGYVMEVNQLKKRGYPWCPSAPDIYQRALSYLEKYPVRNTNGAPARGK